jgi:hypothetical protein
LTGTLNGSPLGPIVSSLAITNGPEVLVYLSTTPLQCSDIQTSRWLGGVAPGGDVIEIVVPVAMTSGTVNVAAFGGAEVNHASTGMSSAYETQAASGSVTFSSCAVMAPCGGMVMATYANGDSVSGTFQADFCTGGQEY